MNHMEKSENLENANTRAFLDVWLAVIGSVLKKGQGFVNPLEIFNTG